MNTMTMIRKTNLSQCFSQGSYKYLMTSSYSNVSIEIKINPLGLPFPET